MKSRFSSPSVPIRRTTANNNRPAVKGESRLLFRWVAAVAVSDVVHCTPYWEVPAVSALVCVIGTVGAVLWVPVGPCWRYLL